MVGICAAMFQGIIIAAAWEAKRRRRSPLSIQFQGLSLLSLSRPYIFPVIQTQTLPLVGEKSPSSAARPSRILSPIRRRAISLIKHRPSDPSTRRGRNNGGHYFDSRRSGGLATHSQDISSTKLVFQGTIDRFGEERFPGGLCVLSFLFLSTSLCVSFFLAKGKR